MSDTATLGKLIKIPATISDDFPRDEWVRFEAYIKVCSDGTVMATRQEATKRFLINEKRVDWM